MRLAGLLKQYDIRSTRMRFSDLGQVRAYLRHDFTDAWDRYCTTPDHDLTAGPAATEGDQYEGHPTLPGVDHPNIEGGKPSHPSQAHHRSSDPRRLEACDGSSRHTEKA